MNLEKLLTDDFLATSQAFDSTPFQESWGWRNTMLARTLADLLLDAKGYLNPELLESAQRVLTEHLYSLAANREGDAKIRLHMLRILQRLSVDKGLVSELHRITKPTQNPSAEQLIRTTLLLPGLTQITDRHARHSALAALLALLRQNVGSCFATAPALVIHDTLPLQFLRDVGQLFGVGRLVRTIGGVAYAMPLSPNTGAGDLLRPLLFANLGEKPWEICRRSPGIVAALEAAGISAEESREVALAGDPFAIVTPAGLLRQILLAHFGLNEEEIGDEHHISSPFPVSSSFQGGETLLKERFSRSLTAAKRAFVAMTDNALLKAWEFTLASFSESKAEFTRWNLYSSLGFSIEENGGIGRCLYDALQEVLLAVDEEIKECESKYDHLAASTLSVEGRLRRPVAEGEREWLFAEYQMRKAELNRVLAERERVYEKGRQLANLLPFLMTTYDQKFRDYFQEIYDAEMHEVGVGFYDDSPAGFRLLYKHGRSNPALWTLIYGPADFVDALAAFFLATETDILHATQVKGLEKEVSALITAVILHVRKPEFLESAFYRLSLAYHEKPPRNPLENPDKVTRKPWAYLSGGTMDTLVSVYFGLGTKPKEKTRWVENCEELLAFFIDTMKEGSLDLQRHWKEDAESLLLAFSPTHAFCIKPGLHSFRAAWESDLYTYSWIRDKLVMPQQRFFSEQILTPRMMEFLVDRLALLIPAGYRAVFLRAIGSFVLSMTPQEFREHVLHNLAYEKWLRVGERLTQLGEELDSLLLRFLPLFPEHALEKGLEVICGSLVPESLERIPEIVESFGKYTLLTAEDFLHGAKTLLTITLKRSMHSFDYHGALVTAMQQEGFAAPSPLLFGDTNWVKNMFGFAVNPGTMRLELMRFDDYGRNGRPMRLWDNYLNGKERREWGVFTQPHDYGFL